MKSTWIGLLVKEFSSFGMVPFQLFIAISLALSLVFYLIPCAGYSAPKSVPAPETKNY